MEAVGSVVYRRVVKLAVVVISLFLGGAYVNRNVIFWRLCVSVEVDVLI
jgi:hypothetical protein